MITLNITVIHQNGSSSLDSIEIKDYFEYLKYKKKTLGHRTNKRIEGKLKHG